MASDRIVTMWQDLQLPCEGCIEVCPSQLELNTPDAIMHDYTDDFCYKDVLNKMTISEILGVVTECMFFVGAVYFQYEGVASDMRSVATEIMNLMKVNPGRVLKLYDENHRFRNTNAVIRECVSRVVPTLTKVDV